MIMIKKVVLSIVAFCSLAVGHEVYAQQGVPNGLADPAVLGILSSKGVIPQGDTALITLDLLNLGSDPIPAGGATWTVTFPKWVWPDQNSIDYGYNDPSHPSIFSSSFSLLPDSTSVWTISVIGSGIPGLVWPPSSTQTDFPVTIAIEGITIGGPTKMNYDCTNDPTISGDLSTGDNHADRDISVIQGIIGVGLDFVDVSVQWIDELDSRVDWTVTNEQHNDHFEVQRSINARDFETIGQVQTIGDHVNEYTYSFIDEQSRLLADDQLYYRIMQVDADGSTSTSRVVQLTKEDINSNLEFSVQIYPNPIVDDKLRLSIFSPETMEGAQKVSIVNATGQVLTTQNVSLDYGQNMIEIDMARYASGIYHIVFENPSIGAVETIKFTKN